MGADGQVAEAGPDPHDSTLDALLRRNTIAVGGAAIARVESRRVEAVLSGAAPFDVPVTIKQRRPRLFRREAQLQGSITQVTVLNGRDASRIDPMQGITTAAPVTVRAGSTSALEVRRAFTRTVAGQVLTIETDVGGATPGDSRSIARRGGTAPS